MVLITDDPVCGASSIKVQQNGLAGGARREVTLGTCRGPNEDDPPQQCRLDPSDAEDDDFYNDDDDIYQEFEEFDFDSLPDLAPDTGSIVSDDSFYPPDDVVGSQIRTHMFCPLSPERPEPVSFFKACSNNNPVIVKMMVRQGVTEEEVRETDKNRRSGLIVACYQGFVDVVIALASCPYVDINWQDNEGNTALITAAQAGHIMISNYLLNYFPGLDIERRNCHGFTALMKAAMQGRAECVRTLVMSGGDVEARDYGRQKTPREWAQFTGRYETAAVVTRLMEQPCAEQFCDTYRLEWPLLEELVARAQKPKSCWQRISQRATVCCSFTLSMKTDPLEDGVLHHMVHITTGLASPLIAPVCRTVAPGSPPCVGKRRYAVQEILRKQRVDELKNLGPERLSNYKRLFQNSRVLLVPKKRDRRASLQPPVLREVADAAIASAVALRRSSLLPLHMMRRSSVRPGIVVPKVRLCKAPAPSFIPERERRKSHDTGSLQVPKWNYKAIREERKRVEEEDRQRLVRRR